MKSKEKLSLLPEPTSKDDPAMSTTLETISPFHMGRGTSEFPDSVLVGERPRPGNATGVYPERKFTSLLPVDVLVYLAITALVLAAWEFSRMGYFKAGDNTGYWICVAGGVMMILLFSYPLRKYFTFARSWGRVKWWFLVHM